MSDNKKTRYEVFTTPIGQLEFPWITKADTRYDPEGVFQTKLVLPFEDVLTQELIAKLAKVRDDFVGTLDVAKQKSFRSNDVYEEELNDEGEATGNIKIKAKLKAVVTPREGDSFTQAPEIIFVNEEESGRPIYGGTMARLKGQIVPYTNAAQKIVGVTLRLRSVQVVELVSGEGGAYWSDFS